MSARVPLRYPRLVEEAYGTPSSGWPSSPEHGRGFWLTECDRFALARFGGMWTIGPNYCCDIDIVEGVDDWLEEVGLAIADFSLLRDAASALGTMLEEHPCPA